MEGGHIAVMVYNQTEGISESSSNGPHINRIACLFLAWMVLMLMSSLPNIILNEFFTLKEPGLFRYKLALIIAIILFSNVFKGIAPLRHFFAIIGVLYITEWIFGLIRYSSIWLAWFGDNMASFVRGMLGTQLLKAGVALVMIMVLLIIKKRRKAFFLTIGQLDSTAEPVYWVGMFKALSWRKFGVILSLCISTGTLVFLLIAGLPSVNQIFRVLPIIPFVLFFAVINAFCEELNYRASLLSSLCDVVGNRQALLMTAGYFGLGHYYGVPYGIVGVIMSSLLGWMLGKSMIETRGFFWAWLIHFAQDVLIFTFMAIGSVTPGGR